MKEEAIHRATRLLAFALFLSMFATAVLHAADATPVSTPKRGGTLRLVWQHEFGRLDPMEFITTDDWAAQRFMFRGLFDYDDHNQLILEQAEDWSLSEDRKTYTFHLLPGVRFANGREVEADDYVFSLERILDPRTASQGQSYLVGIRGADEFIRGNAAHVSGLRAPDKRTLVIELTEPSFVFRYKLAMPFTYPVPREVVAASERGFREHLSGSGPYQLARHVVGMKWHLVRNPFYAGPDGYPDEVDLTIGGDFYLHTMMVERGEADFSRLNPQDLLRLRRDRRWHDQVKVLATAEVDFICMNTELKPFDNALVRRAVNHALDRERLTKLEPPHVIADGIVPSSMPWENPGLHRYEHDPGKARALLREAGYPDGFSCDLWFIQGYLGRVPEAIQEELGAVGIRLNLQPVSSTALNAKLGRRRQAQMGLWGWVVDYPDASSFFDPILNGAKITDEQCLNFPFFNNPEVNRLLVQADVTFDVAERTRILQRVEQVVMDDAPWAPILHESWAYLCHPRLRGFRAHPLWIYRLEKLWLDR